MPSTPPEIRYGICSNTRVVWTAPYQASSTSTAPSGMRMDPAVNSVRSVTAKPVRLRSALSRSASDACSTRLSAAIGSTAISVMSIPRYRVGWERPRHAVYDVGRGSFETEEQEAGAEQPERRLAAETLEGGDDGLAGCGRR